MTTGSDSGKGQKSRQCCLDVKLNTMWLIEYYTQRGKFAGMVTKTIFTKDEPENKNIYEIFYPKLPLNFDPELGRKTTDGGEVGFHKIRRVENHPLFLGKLPNGCNHGDYSISIVLDACKKLNIQSNEIERMWNVPNGEEQFVNSNTNYRYYFSLKNGEIYDSNCELCSN